ncbi:hypothetical protein BY996DRAFT_6616384 [Phakopsora pachyrhizi]|nr:hypothetical protein BY996DRAFT_6616384 [Phakopsora pachyrhizi]
MIVIFGSEVTLNPHGPHHDIREPLWICVVGWLSEEAQAIRQEEEIGKEPVPAQGIIQEAGTWLDAGVGSTEAEITQMLEKGTEPAARAQWAERSHNQCGKGPTVFLRRL